MYKRFDFEGDIHDTLECVPLTVRRKLDLALLKISLEGWQALSLAERLTLCHLPVDGPGDLEVYVQVMRAFCARASVPLKPLADLNAAARAWNASKLPPTLAERARALGAPLTDERWRSLDEESRYALLKLCDPKRNPLKIHALLVELGLLPGPSPIVPPKKIVCEPAPR
jgi:hypothetical protein